MYIVYMVYIVYAMYAVYRSLPPVGGVDRRAYPVPPHTIGGGGAVITDHGIIYINLQVHNYIARKSSVRQVIFKDCSDSNDCCAARMEFRALSHCAHFGQQKKSKSDKHETDQHV